VSADDFVPDTKPHMWAAFETLGLFDRYEALIASVVYQHIETHIVETSAGQWTEPVLPSLRDWMSKRVVKWMFLPYARGAKTSTYGSIEEDVALICKMTAEEATAMLQGPGQRFDFHMSKTLCDLRSAPCAPL